MAITNDFSTWTQEEIEGAMRFIRSNLDSNPAAIYNEALALGLTPETVAQAINYTTTGSLSGPYTAQIVSNFGSQNNLQPLPTTSPTASTTTNTTTSTAPKTTQTQTQTFDEWMKSQGYSARERDDKLIWGNSDGRLTDSQVAQLQEQFNYQQAGTDINKLLAADLNPNDAGYVALNPDLYSWFNENLGTNFGSTEDYLNWVYGGGNVVTDQSGTQWFQTPNGPANTVNTPLDYNPQEFDPTDLARMLITAGIGAEFIPMLTGWGTPLSQWNLSGLLSGADAPGGVNPQTGLPFGDNPEFYPPFSPQNPAPGTWPGFTTGGTGLPYGDNPEFYPPNTPQNPAPGVWPGVTSPLPNTNLPFGDNPEFYPPGSPQNPAPGDSPFNYPYVPGTIPGGGTTPPAPGGTTIPGTNLPFDWGSLLGSLVGAVGANEMADAYRDISNQYMQIGSPYRDLLLKSYQPGFSLENEPGYKQAVDTAQNTFLRAASAGRAPGVGAGGNPFDNPNAWAETLKYVTGNVALPYLQNYRGQLTSAGSMGLPQAVQPAMAGASAQGGIWAGAGHGLSSLFPSPAAQQQSQLNSALINQANALTNFYSTLR